MIYADLTENEIEELILSQNYAHIGFINEEGTISIRPITYVYKEGKIYSISAEGEKMDAMRKNPSVCVQIENISMPDSWQSVEIMGEFEEVSQTNTKIMTRIIELFWSKNDAIAHLLTPLRDMGHKSAAPTIVYGITIIKSHGKKGGHTEI